MTRDDFLAYHTSQGYDSKTLKIPYSSLISTAHQAFAPKTYDLRSELETLEVSKTEMFRPHNAQLLQLPCSNNC